MKTQHGMKVSCVNKELDAITAKIIGGAITVHRELGPGLLESTYETCLAYELAQRGLAVERQQSLPVVYRGVTLECGYRIDLLVEDKVIVEVTAVDELAPVHKAQLISYLKLSGCEVGVLMNFNTKILKEGIQRVTSTPPNRAGEARKSQTKEACRSP